MMKAFAEQVDFDIKEYLEFERDVVNDDYDHDFDDTESEEESEDSEENTPESSS